MSSDHVPSTNIIFKAEEVEEEHKENDIEEPSFELLVVGASNIQLDLKVESGTGGIASTPRDERQFWYSLFLQNTTALPKNPES